MSNCRRCCRSSKCDPCSSYVNYNPCYNSYDPCAPRGPTGATGPVGATGSTGATGPTGLNTIAGYAGPSASSVTELVPANIMRFVVGATGQSQWFALSDSNSINVPIAGQSTFILTSQTPSVSWTLGNFPTNINGNGNQFITELPIGIYEISISCTILMEEDNAMVFFALGTHVNPGINWIVDGAPLLVGNPLDYIYNVGTAIRNGLTDPDFDVNGLFMNLSAEGLLEVSSPLSNVGLVCFVSKVGTLSVGMINLTVNKVR